MEIFRRYATYATRWSSRGNHAHEPIRGGTTASWKAGHIGAQPARGVSGPSGDPRLGQEAGRHREELVARADDPQSDAWKKKVWEKISVKNGIKTGERLEDYQFSLGPRIKLG